MDSSTTAPAPAAPDMERLRAFIRQHQFAEALEAGETLLRQAPDDRDALLSVAIAQRRLGRPHEALATLATLEQHHPRFSRLYEERGRCRVDLQEAPAAIESFVAAVTLNHALVGCWRMLEGLFRLTAQADRAGQAASRVASLSQLPAEVLNCVALFADGDLEAAEARVRAYLISHGDHVEAMRLLASIGIAQGVFDDPEVLLAAVLERAPHYRAARREYAGVLLELNRYALALAQIEPMLGEQPDHRELRIQLAACRVGLGDHERAIELYRALLRETPEDPDLHLSIGHAEKTVGSRERAIDSYRRAAASRPDFGDAYWSLANLKTYRFTSEELGRLRAAVDAPSTAAVDRYHLCFALGKALEDGAEYAESFAYYERGNREKRADSRYRPELIENNTRRQIEVCTPQFFARRRGWGSQRPDPIFIVGLPRSGSTLLEQILASHSQVEGTQELANVQQIANNLRGREPNPSDPRYPRILNDLTAEEYSALGERYLADTRIYRTDKAFFIDKMPNNSCCRTRASSMRAASRWRAASAISSSYSPADRSSPTASRTSRATIAPTSSSCGTGTRPCPAGFCACSMRMWSMISRGACAGCSSSAGSRSSRNAWNSTPRPAVSEQRARSRSACRCIARASPNGGISSHGSSRSKMRWEMRSSAIAIEMAARCAQ
jgi:tetratricopeptide (TPR) repeat protein